MRPATSCRRRSPLPRVEGQVGRPRVGVRGSSTGSRPTPRSRPLRRRKTASEDELDAEVHRGESRQRAASIDNLHDLAFLTRGLSEEELTVAVLHHLDGYTQEGIAAALDLSRRTVGKILNRFEEHVKKRAARTASPNTRRASDG